MTTPAEKAKRALDRLLKYALHDARSEQDLYSNDDYALLEGALESPLDDEVNTAPAIDGLEQASSYYRSVIHNNKKAKPTEERHYESRFAELSLQLIAYLQGRTQSAVPDGDK